MLAWGAAHFSCDSGLVIAAFAAPVRIFFDGSRNRLLGFEISAFKFLEYCFGVVGIDMRIATSPPLAIWLFEHGHTTWRKGCLLQSVGVCRSMSAMSTSMNLSLSLFALQNNSSSRSPCPHRSRSK
mmetsp:Transcript_36872/g.88757  ORF Transcript_36872/g.88757 Transcript_36872/m.88757 type:complete len:126 (+) Transcript_36872:739-1116(+)